MQKKNSFSLATGPIDITLRNDLMFHHVMQTSKMALKSFICAAKGLHPSDVKDITLQNPIEIDEAVSNEIILDVLVTLNNNENIDIELQLYYDKDWIKRSLLYLCRTYDSSLILKDTSLRKYDKLKPTTLIAIIDKNVAFQEKRFYSTYQMLNVETHQPYSSLLTIKVLNLSHIELAADEDISSGLTSWAEIFLAKTWEDINRIISKQPFLKEVAEVMYEANADIKKRALMRAHEEYLMRMRSAEAHFIEGEEMIKESEKLFKEGEELRKEGEELRKKGEKLVKEGKELFKKAEEKTKEADEKGKAADEKVKAADKKVKVADEKVKAADEKVKAADEKVKEAENRANALAAELEALKAKMQTG